MATRDPHSSMDPKNPGFGDCDRSLVAGIFHGEIHVFGNRGFPHEKTIHLFRGIFQLAMFDDQRVTRFPVDG